MGLALGKNGGVCDKQSVVGMRVCTGAGYAGMRPAAVLPFIFQVAIIQTAIDSNGSPNNCATCAAWCCTSSIVGAVTVMWPILRPGFTVCLP